MINIRNFYLNFFIFGGNIFIIYLNRFVFVMCGIYMAYRIYGF